MADAQWESVKEQYRALGKNAVSRFLNAAKGTSEAAKKHSQAYDKASDMSDLADMKWAEAKAAYQQTGRNAVERILNNARYRD